MGNLASSRGSRKVMLWDGTVEEFERPITAAELMLDHPLQLVVELQTDSTNGKIKPLPLHADQTLDPNKLYLMLPKHKRGPKATHLSGEDAHHLLQITHSAALTPRTTTTMSSSRFLPLFLKVCAGPGLAAAIVRNSHTASSEGAMNKNDAGRWVPNFDGSDESEGRVDVLTRQFSGKETWKPSLDRIIEKKRVVVSYGSF